MEHSFGYLPTQAFIEYLEVEDIGNVIIEAKTSMGMYYYLVIQTDYGVSRICEFGPIFDYQYDIKKFNFNFSKITYKEGKVINAIEKFLLNPYYDIVEAQEVDFEHIKKYCNIDIFKFMIWDTADLGDF